MEYRIVSADDHIDMPWLPKDLWQKRVSAAWRERALRVADTPRARTGSAATIAGTRDAAARERRAPLWAAVPAGPRRRILCDNARTLHGL